MEKINWADLVRSEVFRGVKEEKNKEGYPDWSGIP
jgi:hypothetical protein